MGSSLTPTGRRLATEALASRLRAASRLPPFCDPRFYALRLGCELAQGAEPTRADLLVYRHCGDGRELGRRIHVALAKAWLLRAGLRHVDTDVAALAEAVALPASAIRGRAQGEIIEAQTHFPTRLIRQRFSLLDTA